MPNRIELTEARKFALSIAGESGALITRYFQDDNWSVEQKADASPVTEADRETERLLRDRITARFPDHGIIGEEFGNENESAEFVWVLDPIDGTASFIHGVPLFGTLIGLLHGGEPVLGLIHQPVTGQLLIGDGATCELNGKAVRVRASVPLSQATLLTTDLANIAQSQDAEAFERVRGQAGMFRTWGDCFGYLLVAAGKADAMCDPILKPWDLLPLIPVLRGAGATVTDWQGGDPLSGDSCIAAAPDLHRAILAVLHSDPAERRIPPAPANQAGRGEDG